MATAVYTCLVTFKFFIEPADGRINIGNQSPLFYAMAAEITPRLPSAWSPPSSTDPKEAFLIVTLLL
jgi:hypothetical protein